MSPDQHTGDPTTAGLALDVTTADDMGIGTRFAVAAALPTGRAATRALPSDPEPIEGVENSNTRFRSS